MAESNVGPRDTGIVWRNSALARRLVIASVASALAPLFVFTFFVLLLNFPVPYADEVILTSLWAGPLVALVLGFLARQVGRWGRVRSVHVDEHRIVLDRSEGDTFTITRSDMAHVHIRDNGVLAIEAKTGSEVLVSSDAAARRQILGVLVNFGTSVLKLRLRGTRYAPRFAVAAGAVALMCGVLLSWSLGGFIFDYVASMGVSLLVGVTTLLCAGQLERRILVVGNESVTLHSGVRHRTWRFGCVTDITVTDSAIVLSHKGDEVRLALEPGEKRAAIIRGWIADARAAFAAAVPVALKLPGRRGGSVTAWLSQLDGFVDRSDYRLKAHTTESLDLLLADVHATNEQRIGAALLLSRIDRASRMRILQVAESTGDALLADALGGAAAGELQAVEDALASMEASDGRIRSANRVPDTRGDAR